MIPSSASQQKKTINYPGKIYFYVYYCDCNNVTIVKGFGMCLHCTALYCTVLCYLHCTGYRRLSLESSLSTCHLAPQILNNKYSPALTGPLGHEELKINPGQSNIATNYKMWGTVTRLEKCTAGILTEKRQSTCFRIVS